LTSFCIRHGLSTDYIYIFSEHTGPNGTKFGVGGNLNCLLMCLLKFAANREDIITSANT